MKNSVLTFIKRSMKTYGLEIVLAEDLSADRAAVFEKQCVRYTIGGVLATCLAFMAGTLIWWPCDLLLFEAKSSAMKTIFYFRIELLLLTTVSIVLLRINKSAAAHPARLGLIVYSVAVAIVGWLIGGSGGFESPMAYSVYTVPMLTILLFIDIRKRLVYTYTITLIFFCALILKRFDQLEIRLVGIPLAWALCTAALSVVCGHLFYVVLRTLFVQRQNLDNLTISLQDQVRDQTEKIRKLMTTVITVQEEERRRISHDLHDELGQMLTRIRMEVDWLREPNNDQNRSLSSFDDSMKLLGGLTDNAHETLDRLLGALRPAPLEKDNFDIVLINMVRELAKRGGVSATVNFEADVESFSETAQTALYRIVQEAMTNIVKHAHASKAWVTFRAEPDHL